MLFNIALRNVRRNIYHSLVIVILMTSIVTVLFIGNSLLKDSDRGLQKTYIDNFTGDIVLTGDSGFSMSLFGANNPAIEEFVSIPVIGGYDAVMDILKARDDVAGITSQVTGAALMDLYGRYTVPLFGVDGNSYFNVFPGVEIIAGEKLKTGQTGVMLSRARVQEIEKKSGKTLKIGDPVKLSMYNNFGFKIREVPLVGIFTYNNPNEVLDQLVLTDSQTLRALNNITLAENPDIELPEEDTGLLGADDNWDDLFMEDDVIIRESSEDKLSLDELNAELSAHNLSPDTVDLSGGSWHFIIIKLKEGAAARRVIKSLKKDPELQKYNLKILDWREAAGVTALLVLLLKFFYNGGFVLVTFAGIIAVINIFIISLFERTREIGTLRAIGASRNYIRLMILLEVVILSLISGLSSSLLGFAAIKAVNTAKIGLGNDLLRTILGGAELHISFYPVMVLHAFWISLAIGLVSSAYPIHMALKIQPVEAVSK